MTFHPPQFPYVLNDTEPRADQTLLEPRRGAFDGIRRTVANKGWRLPAALFLVSLSVLALVSWERIQHPSEDPHFAYLAETYTTMLAAAAGSEEALEKREGLKPFELQRSPPHRNDWASYWEITLKTDESFRGIWLDTQGRGRFKTLDGRAVMLDREILRGSERTRRYFVSFPPAPAVAMMPLVWLQGVDVNDVLFTLIFAALNVMLMFLLLQRMSRGGRSGRSRSDNLWLTLLFGFGTAHFWCSVLGQVWFTALIFGITCTLLYLHAAIDGRYPLLAGLFCGLAFATRTPLVFSAVFFYAFVFFPGGQLRRSGWGEAFKKAALFSIPCLIIGIALLVQNLVRFESLTEFGHTYLAAGSLDRIKTYGLFNAHFLSKNLSAAFTLLPRFQPDAPYVIFSKHGMSLLATTPAFLYLLRPKERTNARDIFWHRVLWLTVAIVAIPGFFYQNTGYEQFGYRFSLDYTPYLVLLLAVGRHPLTWVFKSLILVGVAVNAFGAVTFKRIGIFYSNRFFV